MPTAPPSSTPAPPAGPPPAGKAKLLSGSGRTQPAGQAGRTATTSTQTQSMTLPMTRPSGLPPARTTSTVHAPATAAPAHAGAPRWLKPFIIGGLLLALGMPASVLLSRSMLAAAVMGEQSGSKAALICTGGEGRALDSSSITGWLFGGSYFQCGEWETRDARVQRERDQAEANYLARERARLQSP